MKKIIYALLAVIFLILAVLSFMWNRSAASKLKKAEEAYIMAIKIEQSRPKNRVKLVNVAEAADSPVSTIGLAKNNK